jgi:hypothetical protein
VIISEFGVEPRWNTLGGPLTTNVSPDDYYFNLSPTSEEADLQRQQVIRDQMAIYSSKPFIAGAIF